MNTPRNGEQATYVGLFSNFHIERMKCLATPMISILIDRGPGQEPLGLHTKIPTGMFQVWVSCEDPLGFIEKCRDLKVDTRT